MRCVTDGDNGVESYPAAVETWRTRHSGHLTECSSKQLGRDRCCTFIHSGNGGCCCCIQYYQVSHQMLNIPFCGKYLVLPNGLRLSSGGLYTVTSAELSHRRGARTKFRVTWIYPSPRNLRPRRDLRRQLELSTELIRRRMQKD